MIWVVILTVLAYTVLAGGTPLMASTLNNDALIALVQKWADTCNLDPKLVYGVVMVESSGNPKARNPNDPSCGLMGVTPLIGRVYGGLAGSDDLVLQQLEIPDNNMRAGCRFLSYLQGKYGIHHSVETWIQAYNMGETNFDAGRRNSYGSKVIVAGWGNG